MADRHYQAVWVRGLALGEGDPAVCIPLVAADAKELEEQLELIRREPFDLLEFRADYWKNGQEPEQIHQALEQIRYLLPQAVLLFTYRTRAEGGVGELSDEEYAGLCSFAASTGLIDLIDLEYHKGEQFLQKLMKEIRETPVKIVCSCHDFQKTPSQEELLQLLEGIEATGGDITKLAVMPQSRQDVMDLLQASLYFDEKARAPYISMAMGRLGMISRLSGHLTGSAVTFASAGRASAPGQIPAQAAASVIDFLSEKR